MLIGSTESNTAPAAQSPPPQEPHGGHQQFALLTALFFLWGIPKNLNDVLIRQFMKSFALSRFQRPDWSSPPYYMGYFLLATPAQHF